MDADDNLRRLTTSEFERRFFNGAEVTTVEIAMLNEMRAEAEAVIRANGWDEAKGWRLLLARGLAHAKCERIAPDDPTEQERVVERLLQLEQVAAIMKYETYHLMRDHQALEMREAALRNSNQMLAATVDRLRAENEALIARMRNHEAAQAPNPAPISAPHTKPLGKRIRDFLARRSA